MPRPKLQLVGSCRNEADEGRLQKLKDLAVELNVAHDVEFHKNVMYRFAFDFFYFSFRELPVFGCLKMFLRMVKWS